MEPQRMDVLRVWWFGLDADARGEWLKKRLHGVPFIPWDESRAFGFLDPVQVIRGPPHLQPSPGPDGFPTPPFNNHPADDRDEDWESFYVNW